MRSRMLVGVGLVLLLCWRVGLRNATLEGSAGKSENRTGTFERMTVTRGTVEIDFDLDRLNGNPSDAPKTKWQTIRFETGSDSFFTIRLFNNVLRHPDPGSLVLIPSGTALPAS